jgi:hypothetical protein
MTGMAVNEWQGFKEILLLRFYMTEEELDECRETAMKLLQTARDTAVPMSEEQLSDLLAQRYYTIAQDRLNSIDDTEFKEAKEDARELAWDYIYAMWELDSEEFDLAFLECRYFLIYSPEQLQKVVQSDLARQSLLNGILLTDAEIRDLSGGDSSWPPAWEGGDNGVSAGFDERIEESPDDSDKKGFS